MSNAPRNSVLFLIGVLIVSACGPNQKILNSSVTPETSNMAADAPALSPFERDLRSMRDADFNFIYVFRRRDGGALDSDDRRFVIGVTPAETNRRTLSDGDKAIILGSNFEFPSETMKVLTERFVFEDYSKPESEIINANSNSNTSR